MKYLVSAFVFVVGIFMGCEDSEPDYPIEPHIEFKDLMFRQASNVSELDSIVVIISYRDGDRDLGLEYEMHKKPEHFSPPYHYQNFFVGNNGILTPVSPYALVTNESNPQYFYPVIKVDNALNGKLVTFSLRDLPEYNHLPSYTFPEKCYYQYETVYLLGDDIRIIDSSYDAEELYGFNPSLYKVTGLFYVDDNSNSNNLSVDYLVKQPDGSFSEFDFSATFETCISGFDARFPVIGESKKTITDDPFTITQTSRHTGKIQYTMKSYGFKFLFAGKTLKLRISIKDRALHTSNVIETPEFTLESIRR